MLPSPEQRPRLRRRAMRVLILDDRDRLLLFLDSDPLLDPVSRFWITPGGGVDPGESDVSAAIREIAEETGQVITPGQLRGPLATRTVLHGFSDVITEQDEVFWLVRLPAFTVDTSGHTETEQATVSEHRWWTRAELDASTETIWPSALGALWDFARMAEGGASVPVLELATVEESTLPI